MKSCTFQREADLDLLVREKPQNRRCIILLHGFGANFADLSGLADIVDPREAWDWYFPNAPIEVPFSSDYIGRAWFPLDLARREEMLRRGIKENPDEVPPGLEKASLQINSLIRNLSAKYQEIVLGGFSQGAMVSADAALHSEKPIRAVLQLSGKPLAFSRWGKQLEKDVRKHFFPVFQSHGRYDEVLSYEGAELLSQFWKTNGFPLTFVPFPGGHEIPMSILRELQTFLDAIAT